MFLTIQTWHEAEKILSLAGIATFGRTEADTEELFSVQRDYLYRTYPQARIFTLTIPGVVDVSSTDLRTMLAKGEGGPLLAAKLMPIVLDTHPLNNPWLSYAVYLANFLLPAFLCMFVMFTTVYSISEEIKRRTSREWLEAGNGSIIVALMGKLVPQALIFTAMGMLALSMLYGYAHFPLNSGFFPMFLAMVLMILASQCFALFVTGITRRSRIALSACALWGVLSFSICGFTYPVRSMPELAQIGSNLFQMRHYFLIYVDQALNGIPMIFSWQSYAALMVYLFLPIFILPKLKLDLLEFKYLP